MSLRTIRQICITLLPVLLVGSLTLYYYFAELVWAKALYTISLTANIGYFTNYIAIKMLFRPHYKTAFGRQGLIPKNQDKLADSLSQTLIENFLSKDQWHEYLVKSDLVNKVLQEAKQGSKQWLSDDKNITQVEHFINSYLQQNQTAINQLLSQLQTSLVDNLTANIDPQQMLSESFLWLETQFEDNPVQMQMMIEPIIKTIAENIPEIAHGLSNALDARIEQQDTLKRGIAKVAKWSADFDSDDIKRYLFRLVASFEFRETLFDGLKTLVKEYKDKPLFESNELIKNSGGEDQISVSKLLQDLIQTHLGKTNWCQLIQQQLAESSNNAGDNSSRPATQVKGMLLSSHALVFQKVEAELIDGALHQWIIEELVSMIEKLDLRQMVKHKAKALTPEKMENVFKSMISEQLVFIELLGALLGALSGLALVDISLFLGLAVALGSYYLADYLLTPRAV